MGDVYMFPSKARVLVAPTSVDEEPARTLAETSRMLAVAILELERIARERALPPPDRLIADGNRLVAETLGFGTPVAGREEVLLDLIDRTVSLEAAIIEWVGSYLPALAAARDRANIAP